MAQIIKTDGYIIESEPKNGSDYQLEELQAIVSGFIEVVPIGEKHLMVVNEEGKLKGLGINHVATAIFNKSYRGYDVVVGDVLLCEVGQIK